MKSVPLDLTFRWNVFLLSQTMVVKDGAIDLRKKCGASEGVYIVRIK